VFVRPFRRRELTTAATFIESQTYRPFEIYIVVAIIYLMLSLCLRGILALAGRWLFSRRPARQTALTGADVRA